MDDLRTQRRDTATLRAAPGPSRTELRHMLRGLSPEQRWPILEALTAAASAARQGGLLPLAAAKALTSDQLRPIRAYDPQVREALDSIAGTMLRHRP